MPRKGYIRTIIDEKQVYPWDLVSHSQLCGLLYRAIEFPVPAVTINLSTSDAGRAGGDIAVGGVHENIYPRHKLYALRVLVITGVTDRDAFGQTCSAK